jgi:thiamine biosynthesis protein ThiS
MSGGFFFFPLPNAGGDTGEGALKAGENKKSAATMVTSPESTPTKNPLCCYNEFSYGHYLWIDGGKVLTLKIIFNGYPDEFEGEALSVQDLLDQTQEDDPAVIVEINGRFIHRKDFETTRINEGDKVEFIHPSFGG